MPRPLRKLKRLTLHKALQVGYLRNERRQKKRLKSFGYRLDNELTTNEYLTAYNPQKNKVIFISNGTNPTNARDLYTDVFGIGLGRLSSTDRYKEAERAYEKAKQKYKDVPVTLVGHSLSGAIVNDIVKPSDRAIIYNSANSPFTKKKENVYSYRTAGDPFSAFDLQARTLANAASISQRLNPIQPHNLSNIADKPIFV